MHAATADSTFYHAPCPEFVFRSHKPFKACFPHAMQLLYGPHGTAGTWALQSPTQLRHLLWAPSTFLTMTYLRLLSQCHTCMSTEPTPVPLDYISTPSSLPSQWNYTVLCLPEYAGPWHVCPYIAEQTLLRTYANRAMVARRYTSCVLVNSCSMLVIMCMRVLAWEPGCAHSASELMQQSVRRRVR